MIKTIIGLLLFLLPSASFAEGEPGLLSAAIAYSDLRIASVERSLEILAATSEAKQWDELKPLLAIAQKADDGLLLWYMLPDGVYYTVDRGLMPAKLSDRGYFPDLTAGRRVLGSLVVSKGTGKRSAVIAVPVVRDGKVLGAVGASLFLDKLADEIGSALAPDSGETFFALAPDGLTVLHSRVDRHFLDPRQLGSETLRRAAEEMLSKDSGEVSYQYDNSDKRAIFGTSRLTHWKFAISRPVR